jgi:hypothetical protein
MSHKRRGFDPPWWAGGALECSVGSADVTERGEPSLRIGFRVCDTDVAVGCTTASVRARAGCARRAACTGASPAQRPASPPADAARGRHRSPSGDRRYGADCLFRPSSGHRRRAVVEACAVVKHIGIVACTAQGASLCYRTICVEVPRALGGLIPKCPCTRIRSRSTWSASTADIGGLSGSSCSRLRRS